MKSSLESSKFRAEVFVTIQEAIDNSLKSEKHLALANIRIPEILSLEVNLGYSELRKLTSQLYHRIVKCVKKPDLVIQVSSGNFLVLIPQVLNSGHLSLIAENLIRAISNQLKIEHDIFEIVPEIGLACAKDSNNTASDLYRYSLAAQHTAHRSYKVFDSNDKLKFDRLWILKKDVELAIHDNQFELYFQPKIDLSNLEVKGAEALIRWNHPELGRVNPDEFISVCESTGQIQMITEWVIKSAIQSLAKFNELNTCFQLSINISANNLDSRDLMVLLEDSIDIWDVNPNNLIVEITETTLMKNPQRALEKLEHLREIGLGISIDDFGTGYSSLSYFKDIPATELKIDKSFVDRILLDKRDKDIVSLIVFLAKKFNLKVVAEGIETSEMLEELKELKCDIGQGYYFSKPLSFDDFMIWVDQY